MTAYTRPVKTLHSPAQHYSDRTQTTNEMSKFGLLYRTGDVNDKKNTYDPGEPYANVN
jgi:hypothetical protein